MAAWLSRECAFGPSTSWGIRTPEALAPWMVSKLETMGCEVGVNQPYEETPVPPPFRQRIDVLGPLNELLMGALCSDAGLSKRA